MPKLQDILCVCSSEAVLQQKIADGKITPNMLIFITDCGKIYKNGVYYGATADFSLYQTKADSAIDVDTGELVPTVVGALNNLNTKIGDIPTPGVQHLMGNITLTDLLALTDVDEGDTYAVYNSGSEETGWGNEDYQYESLTRTAGTFFTWAVDRWTVPTSQPDFTNIVKVKESPSSTLYLPSKLYSAKANLRSGVYNGIRLAQFSAYSLDSDSGAYLPDTEEDSSSVSSTWTLYAPYARAYQQGGQMVYEGGCFTDSDYEYFKTSYYQIQCDWSETDNTKKSFILNKPATMTQADVTTGTSTTPMLVTPKLIHDNAGGGTALSQMTQAELTAGTETGARSISPKLLADNMVTVGTNQTIQGAKAFNNATINSAFSNPYLSFASGGAAVGSFGFNGTIPSLKRGTYAYAFAYGTLESAVGSSTTPVYMNEYGQIVSTNKSFSDYALTTSLPSAMTQSDITTGTSTTAMTISPKLFKDNLPAAPTAMTQSDITTGTSTVSMTISPKLFKDNLPDLSDYVTKSTQQFISATKYFQTSTFGAAIFSASHANPNLSAPAIGFASEQTLGTAEIIGYIGVTRTGTQTGYPCFFPSAGGTAQKLARVDETGDVNTPVYIDANGKTKACTLPGGQSIPAGSQYSVPYQTNSTGTDASLSCASSQLLFDLTTESVYQAGSSISTTGTNCFACSNGGVTGGSGSFAAAGGTANGNYAIALGNSCSAYGNSIAAGYSCETNGTGAAIGYLCKSGEWGFATGYQTLSDARFMCCVGRQNMGVDASRTARGLSSSYTPIFVVGDGNSTSARHNAFEVWSTMGSSPTVKAYVDGTPISIEPTKILIEYDVSTSSYTCTQISGKSGATATVTYDSSTKKYSLVVSGHKKIGTYPSFDVTPFTTNVSTTVYTIAKVAYGSGGNFVWQVLNGTTATELNSMKQIVTIF